MAETQNRKSKNSTKNINFSKIFHPISTPDPSIEAPDNAHQYCSPVWKRSEPPKKVMGEKRSKNGKDTNFGTKNRHFGQKKMFQSKNVRINFFLCHQLVAACII